MKDRSRSTADQIRHFGAGDPVLAEHLLASLGRIAALIPAVHRGPLVRQARLVLAAAQTQVAIPEDLERVAAAGAWVGPKGVSATQSL